MPFFAIFCVAPPLSKVTARRSDNIDASGLPDSSSESFCPKVFREHVENVGTFKIGGPSPLQSHLIQIRVAPKSCFWVSFLEEILVLTDFDQMLTPPLIYIVGKLWISAFSWYFWKNISLILQSIRILVTLQESFHHSTSHSVVRKFQIKRKNYTFWWTNVHFSVKIGHVGKQIELLMWRKNWAKNFCLWRKITSTVWSCQKWRSLFIGRLWVY